MWPKFLHAFATLNSITIYAFDANDLILCELTQNYCIPFRSICSDVGITEYSHGGEDDMMLMYYNTEADSYQPDEDVKVKMSFVLNELKSVVESGRKPERGNAYQKFGHVIDSSWQSQQHQQPTKSSKKQTSGRRKYKNILVSIKKLLFQYIM